MKTVPFSSDSAFDTVAYTLVKKNGLSELQAEVEE